MTTTTKSRSRLLSSSVAPSSTTATTNVVIKKVTFSQPSTVAAAVTATTTSSKTSSSLSSGGIHDNRKKDEKKRHILRGKKSPQSVSKPLLEGIKMKKNEKVISGTTKTSTTKTTTSTVDAVVAGGKRVEDDEEVSLEEEAEEEGDGHQCPDYFGVKSYLHHFYETVSVKNPDMYEELEGGADYGYLTRPRKPHCRSLWWKVAVCCGVNLLVVGVVVILVGYLVPRRQVIIGYQNELEVIDRSALRYNYNLDACKLIGLIVFCVGGTVVAVALLFPSFIYNYSDEDWNLQAELPYSHHHHHPPPPYSGSNRIGCSLDDLDENFEPMSPTERKVPVTEHVTRVQPNWEEEEEEKRKKQLLH